MAISEITFTGTNNIDEVLAWMHTNASEYFDDITKDGNTLNCSVNGAVFLQVGFSGNATTGLTLPNGNNKTYSSSDSSANVTKVYKTDKGIALFRDRYYDIFVSKTDEGSTAVVMIFRAQSDDLRIYGADSENSTDLSTYPSVKESIYNPGINAITKHFATAGKAAIVPFVFDNGSHTPNIFLVPFSPFIGTKAIIDLDGTKYVYDGCIALKE